MNDSIKKNRIMSFKARVISIFKETELRLYVAPFFGSIMLLLLGNLFVPGFISIKSILNLLSLSSILILVCVSQQFVVLSAGIDLSVSAFMILGIAWGGALSGSMGLLSSVLLMSTLAAVCGLITGLSIHKWLVPSMVATLSMARLINSGYMAITRGNPGGSMDPILKKFGTGNISGIRYVLITAIIVLIVMELILRKTKFGKRLYLIGTSERAARIAGIRVSKVGILIYVIAAVWSTICGFILLGIVGSMQPNIGSDFMLLSIAAVVIGGTSLAGGKGTFIGSALGAIFITILSNVLYIVDIPEGLRVALQGVILLIILMLYSRGRRFRQ